MIDTVRFRLPGISPTRACLEGDRMNHIFRRRKDGRPWYYHFLEIEGPLKTMVRIVYYPQDMFGNPYELSLVECSLPKLVYGTNVEMLIDVEPALKALESVVNDFFKRTVDLSMAELDRIDLCYNHQVDSHVGEWIQYLFKCHYSQRKTKPYYPTDGVQFYSTKATLSFYDKLQQSKLEGAWGILREESSYVNKGSVRRALHTTEPVLIGNFSPEVVEGILRAENNKLGIEGAVVADKTVALRHLVAERGAEQGMRLFGYLYAASIAPAKKLCELGINERTLYRNKQQIKECGIGPQLGEHSIKLPSLDIHLME